MKLYEKILLGSAGAAGAGTVAWKTLFPWIGYDLQLMNVGMKMGKQREEALRSFLIDKFEKHVVNHPKKTFLIFEDSIYTYEFVDQMACKVANIARMLGLKLRDTVAMMITNEPVFVWTFLGLQKLGIAVAFINHNLKMALLIHSVKAANTKHLIVGQGENLLENVLDVQESLSGIDIYVQGLGSRLPPQGMHSFDPLMIAALSSGIDPKVRDDMTLEDVCCFIYTSGTTGSPKPVVIQAAKALGISCALRVVDFQNSDVLYISLPLYHSAGGGLGLFAALNQGVPKAVFITQAKAVALGCALSFVDFQPSDTVYVQLPLYHTAGSLGLYSAIEQGNPKPVIVSQEKANVYGSVMCLIDLQATDILYIALPLYHTAGGGLGLYSSIIKGATVVLKKKFSASQFWSDCCKYDVTVIQYIGELFRYLLAQPPSKFDSQHKVRAAFGNGLRKDIWQEVNDRFKIPFVAEFFGATEGVTLLLNIANKPGAIGRLSPFLNALDPDPKALVKFDYGTALPIRDENGRCIKVEIGEPGLFISKVPDALVKNQEFSVYKGSKEVNEKKLVRGAFKDEDIYFNYGDVFVQDKEYFIYFKDRIGDTFRWKGENVSTTELANVITSLDFVQDANVYGVTIPGHDGRAGMVALTLNEGSKLGEKELKELYDHVRESLPEYAQPLFVRLLDQAILTGTFKQRKVELVEEGYDLDKVQDPLYFKNTANNTFSTLKKADLPKFLISKL